MTESDSGDLLALIETMFLVASADGEFTIAERTHFMDMAESLSEGKLSSTDLLELIEGVHLRLETEGLDQRLTALALQLKDDTGRRLAYGLATQVALVDGLVAEEQAVLAAMAQAFGLSEAEHEEITASVRFSSSRVPPGSER